VEPVAPHTFRRASLEGEDNLFLYREGEEGGPSRFAQAKKKPDASAAVPGDLRRCGGGKREKKIRLSEETKGAPSGRKAVKNDGQAKEGRALSERVSISWSSKYESNKREEERERLSLRPWGKEGLR